MIGRLYAIPFGCALALWATGSASAADASSNGPKLPAGTLGYGVVLSAIPASNRARNGIVVLEARFLVLDGQQVCNPLRIRVARENA
jgi:hypothetical protein